MTDPVARFAAVPVAPRHDGWTAERQRTFILALADTGCVSDAARAAGMRAKSAYRLRRRPDAEAFDRAWDQALVIASQRLTTLAFERAVYGSTRQIWRNGELVGEERAVSDRLLIFLLQHFDRMRFGNLSGLLPIQMPDPRDKAKAALPHALDAFVDLDASAEPYRPGCDDEFDDC